jgi:hypothetical protein
MLIILRSLDRFVLLVLSLVVPGLCRCCRAARASGQGWSSAATCAKHSDHIPRFNVSASPPAGTCKPPNAHSATHLSLYPRVKHTPTPLPQAPTPSSRYLPPLQRMYPRYLDPPPPALSPALPSPKSAYIHPPRVPLWPIPALPSCPTASLASLAPLAATTSQWTATRHQHSFQLSQDQIKRISMQTKSMDGCSCAQTQYHHHLPPVPTMPRYPVPPLYRTIKSRHSTVK